MSASAGAAAAAAAAAIAQATKASGVVVRVDPEGFHTIVERARGALVVHARSGILSTSYQYLTSYKGLAFYTKSRSPIRLPGDAEVVLAEKIWIPG